MSLSWLGIPAWNYARLNGERSNRVRDWHTQRSNAEPRCSADQWRQRNRSQILYISEMSDRHLWHCIRFASTKEQHRSRLDALLAERADRAHPRHEEDRT